MFELAGQDKAGLLADVTDLLTTNGCNVRSAAVCFVLWLSHIEKSSQQQPLPHGY